MGWSTTDIVKYLIREFEKIFLDLQQIKELLIEIKQLLKEKQ